MSKRVLEILFNSKPIVKILKLLYRNTGQSFSVKGIASRIQEPSPVVSLEIKKLVEIGLLKVKK